MLQKSIILAGIIALAPVFALAQTGTRSAAAPHVLSNLSQVNAADVDDIAADTAPSPNAGAGKTPPAKALRIGKPAPAPKAATATKATSAKTATKAASAKPAAAKATSTKSASAAKATSAKSTAATEVAAAKKVSRSKAIRAKTNTQKVNGKAKKSKPAPTAA